MDPPSERPNSFSAVSWSDTLGVFRSTEERNADGASTSNEPQDVAQAMMDPLLETHAHLTHTSDILDAAFSRLRSLPDVLQNIRSSRNGDDNSQQQRNSTAEPNIGPRHAAIVLSDDNVQSSQRLDFLQRSDTDDDSREHVRTSVHSLLSTIRQMTEFAASLPAYVEDRAGSVSTASQTNTNNNSNNQARRVVADHPQNTRSRTNLMLPSSPALSYPTASSSNTSQPRLPAVRRRSLLENHLRRSISLRDSLATNSNESSTLLGRRVAARIASGATEDNWDTVRSNMLHNLRFRPSDTRSEAHPSRVRLSGLDMERTPINASPYHDERRGTRGTEYPRENANADRGSIIRNIRTLLDDMSTSELFRPPVTTGNFLPPSPPIVRRQSLDDIRILGDTSDRRRPHVDADVQTATQDAQNNEIFSFDFDPLLSDRSYTIRRQINADGEEVVHNITMDNLLDGMEDDLLQIDQEFRSQMSPRPGMQQNASDTVGTPRPFDIQNFYFGTTAINNERPRNSQGGSNSAPSTGRRRRGWARLNADGDEIPLDEEEELERIRTQRRIQQANQTNENLNAATRVRMEYLAPAARSVALYPDAELSNWTSTRHGGFPHGPFDGPFDVYRERGNQAPTTQMYFGSEVPYHINPLPMALSEMVPSENARSDTLEQKRARGSKPSLSEFAIR